MNENFAQLLEEYSFNISEGQIIDAIITFVKRDLIIVDIGFKGESSIQKSEFLDIDGKFNYNVGDTVPVYVSKLDNGSGEIVLSFAKSKEASNWKNLEKAFKDHLPVKAKCEKAIRGGIIVSLDGAQGFLPNSLVDIKPVRDIEQYIGKVIEVKIIKIDEEEKTILVSRKAMFATNQESPQVLLSKIKEGDIVTGTVKNITDYGVFFDLGGIDGLLHITDISWSRIENPAAVFEMGQEVRLMVSKYNPVKKQISLSKKALDNTPWVDFLSTNKVGDIINCKVGKFTDHGVFVLIKDNLDGLIHRTELDWKDKDVDPAKYLKEGEIVALQIIEIDIERNRVSLSFKRVNNNPWEDFAKKNPIDSQINARVKSVNDFGILVDLEGGCEATIPSEYISWNPRERYSAPKVSAGDTIKAVLKDCRPIKERIQLSIRDLTKDPLIEYQINNPVGSKVSGKVIEVSNKNITLEIKKDVFALIKHADAGISPTDSLKNFFANGEEVSAKLTGLNGRYLTLSIKDSLK
jgi:small subunit ribosomal protein S1